MLWKEVSFSSFAVFLREESRNRLAVHYFVKQTLARLVEDSEPMQRAYLHLNSGVPASFLFPLVLLLLNAQAHPQQTDILERY